MPINPTYPGVYIEELPSGVRTVVGVATSITAFIGRTAQGPVNEPVIINNFGDFERIFGGLSLDSTVSFAVNDFYRNGGSQAIVVRLFGNDPGGVANALIEIGTGPDLVLAAAYEGTWANGLEATLDLDVSADVAARMGVDVTDLFNLTLTDTATGVTEQHRNVTVVESSRRVDRVLAGASELARVQGPLPTAVPVPNPPGTPVTVAVTTAATAEVNLGVNDYLGDRDAKTGIFALEDADLFNLLCIPPPSFGTDLDDQVWAAAAAYATERRAMVIIDPKVGWDDVMAVLDGTTGYTTVTNAVGSNKKNTALYFPLLNMPNPLRDNQRENFVPCGAVAGVFARTDTQRGVWKAPAGLEANLNGVAALSVPLSDPENGQINPLGVNALRVRPAAGPVVWGARTLDGDDRLASEWKYVPVRRLALFIEESLYRGTQWVVFEPNDEPLWAQIRLNLGAFMQNLFRQGAFQGQTPQEAYFVKVDRETTTQNDIDRGIVNIVVGFAPLKPAEFVIIKIQQIAGDLQT